jgi:hypothetical protein
MIGAWFWCERKKRRARVRRPRYRRDWVGEPIQIDGSEHRWFEDREPMCTLLVYIDDATSRLMHGEGVDLRLFRRHPGHLEAHGKPVAFYSDKHSVLRVNGDGSGVAGDGMTHSAAPARPEHRYHLRQLEPGQGGRVERARFAKPPANP